MGIQRRLQDLEHASRNGGRTGKIPKDGVKFDKEQNGWLCKFVQGEGDEAFESDWLKWGSFSHGSIKMSIPPREGQLVKLTSPQGQPEMGYLEAHHYDPDNVAPHDKPDEMFIRIEKPSEKGKTAQDKDECLDILLTKDGPTITIGKTTHKLTKDSQSIDTPNDKIKADKHEAEIKDEHKITTQTRTVKATRTSIQSDSYQLGGKVLINCA